MHKIIKRALLTLTLISANAYAMKADVKAQITNKKAATYAVTVHTNHGPAHEVLRPNQTIHKANAKDITLRGEGTEFKLRFNDNGSTELITVKGKAAHQSVNSHNILVVIDANGVKLTTANETTQSAQEPKAKETVKLQANTQSNAQSNANSNIPAPQPHVLQDIKLAGPEVMQGTKVQVTSRVNTPYVVSSRSPQGRYNEPIKRGQTIHKANVSEIGFTGDGAQHKLVFNNNGSTDLFSLKGDASTKVSSVNTHNVVIVIESNGLRLQEQAILVKEFIPGTGVGIWKGKIEHGDINL